jgi:hypothetical protein
MIVFYISKLFLFWDEWMRLTIILFMIVKGCSHKFD